MPRIFDNIEKQLLPTLVDTLQVADRADFCVGYFNLRGWRQLADQIERWEGGEDQCCRLLVGMHVTPTDELRSTLRSQDPLLDNATVARHQRIIAEEFRQQLMFGTPTNEDEATLRQLSTQLHSQKLFVKVYLRHPLHAKLYLLHRQDANNPVTGFLGSSNLTLAGLKGQGELNVDVLEHDACHKLVNWFEDRWTDRWCIDISKTLAAIIDESWASEKLVLPYHVYLKIAYHLAQEARAGQSEYRVPKIFGDALFDFQQAAVQTAAHHLNKRGGVLIGDVVGLGKTIIATALAKIFEDDHHTETLIICPKNLVSMWADYVHRYHLHAKILPLSKVIHDLPNTPRYRVVLIDESHNLRNKEGKRWKVIRDYIQKNESQTILLSATPYNKTYLDLSAQLALFLREDAPIGVRPEKRLAEMGGEDEFIRRHQCPVRSLAAFEKSQDPDDWRDLMRLFMVRRTRGFIMQHYAKEDERGRHLLFPDGGKSYFPKRVPKNLSFVISDDNPADPYARFYSDDVINAINGLNLPRYGLGNHLEEHPPKPINPAQAKMIEGLSRAGTRLMGFCRTNLFKRLESAGPAFLQSIERHILRNFIVLHAIENDLDIPLGTQGAELLDTRYHDNDPDDAIAADENNDEDQTADPEFAKIQSLRTEADFRARAAHAYIAYSTDFKKRFKWLPSHVFKASLAADLQADALALLALLKQCGEWDAQQDAKLGELIKLINTVHCTEKLLIFTQFADTAHYLKTQLQARGIKNVAEATGQSADPTTLAWRFSPVSNDKRDFISPRPLGEGQGVRDELRVLIATDVLSEGQNLQDAHIIVNYDLPWAIIRLIQRAGRVDRIGQQADTILCYSFVPADGVERLIKLRERVRQRLIENKEVVGSDETFFDDDQDDTLIRDLYTEKNGILDDDFDSEVDLASQAYQIWKNATDADPSLIAKIESMPNVVYATKAHAHTLAAPKGVLVYMRTSQENDTLTWINQAGEAVTQSQYTILKAAACNADTPALARMENHHDLAQVGMNHILQEESHTGGALGRPTGARFKSYTRLKQYLEKTGNNRDLFITDDHIRRVQQAQEDIHNHPLYQSAIDALNRQFKAGIHDAQFIELILNLREDGRLCAVEAQPEDREPRLICSMGLA
ncbi:MAG: phospholipase D-like domain-containing protein [Gallionella sp.]|nr:phospholipase D-like domain-containing protein [Gallionella sp.]MDD4958801.1 phospholipase D-like domain-containing protein [Gallionella sp.]